MRRYPFVVAAAVTLSLLIVARIGAISNGAIDTTHPNVGAMVVEFEAGTKSPVCSGSLISPAVFLTAAHCLAFLPQLGINANQVYVTFDVNVLTASTFVQATGYQFDPGFGRDLGDLHDLGVIILAEPVTWITPVELPTVGLLDEMAAQGGLVGREFVNVGYGFTPEFKRAPPRASFDGYRRVVNSLFQGLTRAWLRLLMNSDATGLGGVCYGDSGSPKFLPYTNTIVAVTSGGDRICRAENYNYRLDTSVARAFLGQFVTLP